MLWRIGGILAQSPGVSGTGETGISQEKEMV